MNKMIRELLSLRGKEVKVFGQPTTLKSEVDLTLIDTVDVLENLKAMCDCHYSKYEIVDDVITYTEEEIRNMGLHELMDLTGVETYEEIESLIENEDYNDYYKELSFTEYVEYLHEIGELEEITSDNTFNWNAPLTNHLDFRIYRNKYEENYIVEIKAHRYGDVRANYTEEVYLVFNHENDFIEAMFEVEKSISLEIDGVEYILTFNATKEGNKFDIYCDENNFDVYDQYLDGDTKEELTDSLMKILS